MLQYVTPETLTLEYLFYGFNIWQRTFYGLYRARRRCGRGRFASLIPVGLAPDIPFTRPWAAMPPTATPPAVLY